MMILFGLGFGPARGHWKTALMIGDRLRLDAKAREQLGGHQPRGGNGPGAPPNQAGGGQR